LNQIEATASNVRKKRYVIRQDCDRENDSFNRNIPTECEVADANKDGNHQFWKEHWKLRGGPRWRH